MKSNIKTKFIRSLFLTGKFTLLSLVLMILACKDNDSEFRNKELDYNSSMLYLIQYRNEGNCLRTERTGSNKGRIYCDRRPRGLCNSTELILTSGERTSRFSDINDINKYSPDCGPTIAASGLLLEAETTNAQTDTINSNNFYNFIDQCENSNLVSNATLFTNQELDFLNSPKGKIAIAADVLNISPGQKSVKDQAGACLIHLVRDDLTGIVREDLKKIIADNRVLAKVKSVSCLFSDTTPNNCPSSLDKFK